MGKILFWFVVIVAVLFAARLLSRSANAGRPARQRNTGPSPLKKPDMSHAEAMVRCEHCGIHMPRSQAYLSDGKTWCGQEHARLGHHNS